MRLVSKSRIGAKTKRLYDAARYTYLPRLKEQAVLVATIEAGIQHEDFFGLASGQSEGRYTGLVFGGSGQAYLAEEEVLLSPAAARAAMPQPEPTDDPGLTGPVAGTAGESASGFDTAGEEGRRWLSARVGAFNDALLRGGHA